MPGLSLILLSFHHLERGRKLRRRPRHLAILALTSFLVVSPVIGGPVILGGDDLTDHGTWTGTTATAGWLYIQKAIQNILAGVTRPGNNGSIAALGSAPSTATTDDAGAAVDRAGQVLGRTVNHYEGAAAINQFFIDLAAGTVNPAMIHIAGTGANNDLSTAEGDALTANALAISNFVSTGGGLMAHGSGADAYGWLVALLPGLTEVSGCQETGATLTPAGMAAFPGLSNSDIDATAGPCHSHFEGNFGGLTALALDGSAPTRFAYIIGGGAGTVIVGPTPTQVPAPTQVPSPSPTVAAFAAAVPTLSFPMMALFAVVLAALGFVFMRRN